MATLNDIGNRMWEVARWLKSIADDQTAEVNARRVAHNYCRLLNEAGSHAMLAASSEPAIADARADQTHDLARDFRTTIRRNQRVQARRASAKALPATGMSRGTLVVVVRDRSNGYIGFLTEAGRLVSEYPDAHLWCSPTAAAVVAERYVAEKKGHVAEVTADYGLDSEHVIARYELHVARLG